MSTRKNVKNWKVRRSSDRSDIISVYLFFFFLICLAVPATQSQSLSEELEMILEGPESQNAWWGVSVVDLATGDPVFEHNADRNFITASGAKLFTTAAALDQLGPEYRYETRIYSDGAIEEGTLKGNIVVRGSGDPSIGSEYTDGSRLQVFYSWADQLLELGVQRITGNIIGDDNIFDDTPLGFGWAWDDIVWGYSAQVGGLPFHDNVVNMTATAQQYGESASLSWSPLSTDYITVIDSSRTIESGGTIFEGYQRAPGSNTIVVTSHIPQGSADVEKLAVHNPTRYFVHVLHSVLESRGITIEGAPVDADDLSSRPDYADLTLIDTHTSPPLLDIVEVINKESQNLYAELLLRTLGVEVPMPDTEVSPGSAEKGIEAAMRTFAAASIDTSVLQIADGSGLSRRNLISPTMFVQLIQYMASHENSQIRAAFQSSLPVAGEDGTLAYRFRSSNGSAIRLQGKTGTMGNVSMLSGFVHTSGGRHLAFAIICNNYTISTRSIRRIQDRFLSTMASRL